MGSEDCHFRSPPGPSASPSFDSGRQIPKLCHTESRLFRLCKHGVLWEAGHASKAWPPTQGPCPCFQHSGYWIPTSDSISKHELSPVQAPLQGTGAGPCLELGASSRGAYSLVGQWATAQVAVTVKCRSSRCYRDQNWRTYLVWAGGDPEMPLWEEAESAVKFGAFFLSLNVIEVL